MDDLSEDELTKWRVSAALRVADGKGNHEVRMLEYDQLLMLLKMASRTVAAEARLAEGFGSLTNERNRLEIENAELHNRAITAEHALVEALKWSDSDQPIPEDVAIDAAHPIKSGSHSTYQEAMRMVGAKRSKGALVDLVNWLLLNKTPK